MAAIYIYYFLLYFMQFLKLKIFFHWLVTTKCSNWCSKYLINFNSEKKRWCEILLIFYSNFRLWDWDDEDVYNKSRQATTQALLQHAAKPHEWPHFQANRVSRVVLYALQWFTWHNHIVIQEIKDQIYFVQESMMYLFCKLTIQTYITR